MQIPAFPVLPLRDLNTIETAPAPEPPICIMALHAMLYCERLFYLEEVEEIRVADANVYAGRRLHDDVVPDDDVSPEKRSFQVESESWGLSGRVRQRIRQFKALSDPEFCVKLTRVTIQAKVQSQLRYLMRATRGHDWQCESRDVERQQPVLYFARPDLAVGNRKEAGNCVVRDPVVRNVQASTYGNVG